MYSTFTPKTIAMGTISGLLVVGASMAVEITRAQLYEIRKSIAALEHSAAGHEAAQAQKLDAENKLTGTQMTAEVMKIVGQLQSNAMVIAANYARQGAEAAAKTQGESVVQAQSISSFADNELYRSFTGPMFGEPVKRVDRLNTQIVRLQRELAGGVDRKTGAVLSSRERESRIALVQALEEELETVKETSAKNFNDTIGVILGTVSGGEPARRNPFFGVHREDRELRTTGSAVSIFGASRPSAGNPMFGQRVGARKDSEAPTWLITPE